MPWQLRGVSEHVYTAGGGRLYAFVNDDQLMHSAAASVPWMVYVHGGSWAYGAPNGRSSVRFCRHEARLGITCFSADYPLAPARIWPAQLDMVRAQVAWVRTHRRRFHLDPHAGFVAGHSAGGLMAGIAGLDEPQLAGVVILDGATSVPLTMTTASHLTLRAHAADLVGVRSAESPLARSAGVLAHVGPDTPRVPFLVIQDLHDPVVDAATSTQLARGLTRDGFPVTYDLLPFATHETQSNPQALAMLDAWVRGRVTVADASSAARRHRGA